MVTTRVHSHSQFPVVAGLIALATMVACGTEPTSTTSSRIGEVSLAKPVNCNSPANLVITMRDQAGDAVLSDGGGSYAEGVDGVGAHLNGINGNLMLTVQETTARTIGWSTSASTGQSNDRLYTNSHTNPGGDNACGLFGMVVGSTGSAALGFELWQGNREDIIHFGKSCSGSADASTRVTTAHPDANTWTITGTSGRHCRANTQGNGYSQVGTAGPFQLTLVRQ
jgi:hypothetical protein